MAEEQLQPHQYRLEPLTRSANGAVYKVFTHVRPTCDLPVLCNGRCQALHSGFTGTRGWPDSTFKGRGLPTATGILSAEAVYLLSGGIDEVRGLDSQTLQMYRIVSRHLCLQERKPNDGVREIPFRH